MKKTNVIAAIAVAICLIIIFLWYNSPDQRARRNAREIKQTFKNLLE